MGGALRQVLRWLGLALAIVSFTTCAFLKLNPKSAGTSGDGGGLSSLTSLKVLRIVRITRIVKASPLAGPRSVLRFRA